MDRVMDGENAQLVGKILRTGRMLHNKVHRDGQYKAIWILYKHGNMTQRELLDFFGIKSASLSETLKKVEAKGYIKREKSEADRRNINLSLTESGVAVAEKIGKDREQTAQEVLKALNQEERQTLADLLDSLLDDWN